MTLGKSNHSGGNNNTMLSLSRVWYRILPEDTIDSLQSFSVKFKDRNVVVGQALLQVVSSLFHLSRDIGKSL